MPKRRRSRVIAFQLLYSMAYNPQDVEEAARRYCLLEPDRKRGLPPFAIQLAKAAHEHQWELDALINANLENWRPERLTLPDRLLLRLACAEFLHFNEVPAKVTLDEYIELARQFSDDAAPGFVNGVLDAVLKSTPMPAEKVTVAAKRPRRGGRSRRGNAQTGPHDSARGQDRASGDAAASDPSGPAGTASGGSAGPPELSDESDPSDLSNRSDKSDPSDMSDKSGLSDLSDSSDRSGRSEAPPESSGPAV